MFFGKLFGGKKSEEDELFDSPEPSPSSRTLVVPPTYNIILIGKASLKAELLKVMCGCQSLTRTSFTRKEFKLSFINTIKLNIWNITGNEGFGWIIPQYCRGAHGVILCYDVSKKYTFKHIDFIVESNGELFSCLKIPICIIGISEKKGDNQDVPQSEVQKLADKIGAKTAYCSLDDDKGINQLFKKFVNDIVKNYKIKSDDKGNENNIRGLPPKSSPSSSSSSSLTMKKEEFDKPNSHISQISICKYEGPKRDVEVQRNEDGLFGNYYANHNCLCYNVSILGNPRIGKSCLCARYLVGHYIDEINKLWMCSFTLPNSKYLRLRMIEGALPNADTDPRLEFSYSHSHAILLCYDITDRASFNAVRGAAAEVRGSAMRGAVVMVVGLRYDSNESCVCVPGSEGKALADSHGMHFRECSGKDNVGVQEILSKILFELHKIDSFALPIRTDDANRVLPLSMSSSNINEDECKMSQPPSLLEQLVSEQIDKKKGGDTTSDKRDRIFRILSVGDYGVGKTHLLLRYVDGTYTDSYNASIPTGFILKNIKTNDGKIVKLMISDVHERFRTPTSSFFRGIQAVIICLDTTNPESFKEVKHWVGEIERYACEGMPIVIVGTKCDCPLKVDLDAVSEYVDSINAPFVLCSAKTGDGVDEVFEETIYWVRYKRLYADF